MVLIIFLYMDFGAKALVRFLHNERGMDAFDVLGMQLWILERCFWDVGWVWTDWFVGIFALNLFYYRYVLFWWLIIVVKDR